MDKGLAEWTRAWQIGQGLGRQNGQGLGRIDKGFGKMDKGLADWTRAWQNRQGLGRMDKGLAE